MIPTLIEMEEAIVRNYDLREYTIIPNIRDGFGIDVHECDLFIVGKSRYATEVEIKRSKADLVKDKKKLHYHAHKKIRLLYFAIPEKLQDCVDLIPDKAGVILIKIMAWGTIQQRGYEKRWGIKPDGDYIYAHTIREATINKQAEKLTEEEISNIRRLGCSRIWGLKRKLIALQKK